MSGRRPPRHVFFASCNPGVEAALHREVAALRLARGERQVGGVRFEGVAADGWRAVLHLRSAVRVYRQIARFEAADADELYRRTLELPWDAILRPTQTFAVEAKTSGGAHSHSGFVALRIKDAVADWFRQRWGKRPSVDAARPDVPLSAHVQGERCTLSLDLAGRPLYRRGYRQATVPAPVNETLAAALVLLSGWDQKSPFLDPLCGSGTIPIEAALLASGTAPGLLSPTFAFRNHPDFDADLWQRMLAEARAAIHTPRKVIIRGSDSDAAAVAAAAANADAAGVRELLGLAVADVRDFAPTRGWGATVVSNPPYGVRLEDVRQLRALYREMGAVFRERCRGFHVHLVVADGRLAKALQLKAAASWPVENGGLSCRFNRYEIY